MIPGVPDLLTGVALGLAGAGHCLGMCGGLVAGLGVSASPGLSRQLAFHGGRLLSYVGVALVLGTAAGAVSFTGWTLLLRLLAGLLLVGMGLYLADWWYGLRRIEHAGGRLWGMVSGALKPILPPRTLAQTFTVGLCWAFLPCGLIYSTLAWAVSSADGPEAAWLMLAFGVGTLPAMGLAFLGGQKVKTALQRPAVRHVFALYLIVAGLWTGLAPLMHSGPHAPPGAHGQQHH